MTPREDNRTKFRAFAARLLGALGRGILWLILPRIFTLARVVNRPFQRFAALGGSCRQQSTHFGRNRRGGSLFGSRHKRSVGRDDPDGDFSPLLIVRQSGLTGRSVPNADIRCEGNTSSIELMTTNILGLDQ